MLAGIEDRQDIGVVKSGGGLDFADEPIRAKGLRQDLVENLDRHESIVAQIPSPKDGRHAASANFFLESVTVLQGGGEPGLGSVWNHDSDSVAQVRLAVK